MILTDTGPLVALIDEHDAYHQASISAFSHLPLAEPLLTTMACLTESMYFLGKSGHTYQTALWRMRELGKLTVHSHQPQEIDRMASLMAQYRNIPMDLADASLIAAAESLDLRHVFTFDSDFYVYRLNDGSALEIIR